MKPNEPVVRSSEWVEREYGQEKWPAIRRIVERECAAESELTRILGRVVREENGPEPLAPTTFLIGGTTLIGPQLAAHAAHQALITEAVLTACSERTQSIVELGSGWGRNLLALWLSGGPRDAHYVGAEYTEAGRGVFDRLAGLHAELRACSVHWDYHEPDLSALSRAEEAVVFTAHSVEQIPRLRVGTVDAIRALARRVVCLHFEPVGWQLEGEHPGSSQAYAERHDYNRNLVGLLRDQERAGALKIDFVLPDAIGVNPSNATTVIGWHSTS